jgi:predicted enzyme related to lactoylglutathione lyase
MIRSVPLLLVLASAGCALHDTQAHQAKEAVQIPYLEIVTSDPDATCIALEKLHGARFGEPDPGLGNARTAALSGGGLIGVRGPLREDEGSVVRPYLLVHDIEVAVETARAAGGEFAMTPTDGPGRVKFAIYFQGGIQHGLWQR